MGTKDEMVRHLDNVFGKVPTVVRKEWTKFGEPPAKPGVQSVFAEIKVALKDLKQAPMLGNQAQAIDTLLKMVEAKEEAGVKKYGASLETWNGRDPLQDAMEEQVDWMDYMVQARIERADMIELINHQKRQLGEKDLEIERLTRMVGDLEAARNAAALVQTTAPGAGMGAMLDAVQAGAVHATVPDPLAGKPPHARAHRRKLCTTGLIPTDYRPGVRDALRDLCLASYANSALHGFWGEDAEHSIKQELLTSKPFTVIPEKLMLMVSELSEALEAYRSMDSTAKLLQSEGKREGWESWLHYRKSNGKPDGFLVELADCIIRIGDLVGSMGLDNDLANAIFDKMEYNAKRPHMHGKNC
jgi:hypothetical protein